MADSSWDNSGMPKSKQGMSTLAKVGLGCGIVFLLLVLTCGSCLFLGFQKASSSIDASWRQMTSTVEALRTDEGAKGLYSANPGLKDNFATEEDFLKAVGEWRPKLGPIPQQRPDLKALFASHQMEYNARSLNGRKTVSVRYRMNGGARLFLETEENKLVDIRVE